MKSRLSATHLLRHLALFLFISVFLLTMIRAAYVLWQFPKVMASNALIDIFVMGLRYDLALIGILLLPVIIFGCVFGLSNASKSVGKFLVIFLLMFGMIFILLTELITPYFMAEQSLRPDLAIINTITDPVSILASLWSSYMIPAAIGLILCLLIIIAYAARLETNRLFRFPLAPLSTLLLLIVGSVLCALAVYSGIDPTKPALSPATGLVSKETVLNEITLNTGYKLLYSIASPYL